MKSGFGDKAAVSVAFGVGIGVAAVAGFAAGGALGMGMLAVSTAAGRRNIKPALQPEEVKRDVEGRIENWAQVLKTVQQGGVSPELKAQLWPLLLGVYDPCSTAAERAAELSRLRRLYTKLVLVCKELDAQVEAVRAAAAAEAQRVLQGRVQHGAAATPPASPIKPSGNLAAFAEAHRIIVMDAVRTDLRAQPSDAVGGGKGASEPMPTVTVLPVSVGDGLPELMMAEPPDPEPAEAVATGRLPLWRSALATGTLDGAAHVAPTARRLMMRLVNVLSAYAVHDPETGYCQGMSDLAAAFVQLFDDDALAFACFERLMRDGRQNFKHDETGIRAQLAQVARIVSDTDPPLLRKLQALGAGDCTFAYRMVVVMLRRELPLAEALTLWEARWATQAAAEAEAAAASKPSSVSSTPTTAMASQPSSAAVSSGNTPAGLLLPTAGLASTAAAMDLAARAVVAAEAASGSGGGSVTSSRGTTPKVLSLGMRPASGIGRRAAGDAPPPPDFLLQFVAAVVRAHRGRILSECRDADDVLRLFNSVSVDFWTALAQARKQFKAYAQGIAVMQRL